MNKEEKTTISVNEEDVQNIINAYEKDIEYINQLEKENQELKEINEEHKKLNGELREENKKYKEVIEKLEKYIRLTVSEKEFIETEHYVELLDILNEVK